MSKFCQTLNQIEPCCRALFFLRCSSTATAAQQFLPNFTKQIITTFKFNLTLALVMCCTMAFAQTARLQIIRNSPTPTVDVYVNGNRLLDNFAFRTATPYIDVRAGVLLNIGVGLGKSVTVRDTLVNIPVVLLAGRTYIAVASGIVGNATRPFRLAVTDMGRKPQRAQQALALPFFTVRPTRQTWTFGRVATSFWQHGLRQFWPKWHGYLRQCSNECDLQLASNPRGCNDGCGGL